MSSKTPHRRFLLIILFSLTLAGCFHPPYNHFRTDSPVFRDTAKGTGAGLVVGAFAGGVATGGIIGGVGGAAIGLYQDTPQGIIRALQQEDIQYIQYGDTRTLIVPTDKYFVEGSPHLNELQFEGLNNIVKLIKLYPNSKIYVAGFTDNIGNRIHKSRISTAQAETMLTYLWANDIKSARLQAEGYGEKYTISDNLLIHGSAQNRRLEIQWVNQAPSSQTMAMRDEK